MVVEGEAARRKQSIPLLDIWKIYLTQNNEPFEEMLYKHAAEERNFGIWSAYIRLAKSAKVDEAISGVESAVIGCVDAELTKFAGGDYDAINRARSLAQKAKAISPSKKNQDLLTKIDSDQNTVHRTVDSAIATLNAGNWDRALEEFEPVKKFAKSPERRDLADGIEKATKGSHDSHLVTGDTLAKGGGSRGLALKLGANEFREALKEYEVALSRLPNSTEARRGKKEMEVNLALIEAQDYRQKQDPAKARQTLLAILDVYKGETRLMVEFKLASCELAAQLFDQAKRVVAVALAPAKPAGRLASAPKTAGAVKPSPGAKPVTAAKPSGPAPTEAKPEPPPMAKIAYKVRPLSSPGEKRAFREALDKLTQAVALCEEPDYALMLAQLSTVLSDYHLAQAKRLLGKKTPAAALLHLQAVRSFQQDRTDLTELLDNTRDSVQKRASIHAGVAIRDVTGRCGLILGQIQSETEAAVTGGNTTIQLLAADQAASALHQIRSATYRRDDNLYAIISGDIRTCNASAPAQPRMVSSSHAEPNPRYQELDRQVGIANEIFNQCKRQAQGNEAACSYQKSQVDTLKIQRNNTAPGLSIPYQYQETKFTYTGQLATSFQIDDGLTRGTRQAGQAATSISEACTERQGVHANDQGQANEPVSTGGGWRGFLSSLATASRSKVTDSSCPRLDARDLMLQMTEKISSDVQSAVRNAINSVPQGFLDQAKRSTDADTGLENYIFFALVSSNKSGADYTQSVDFIRQQDEDLKIENALK